MEINAKKRLQASAEVVAAKIPAPKMGPGFVKYVNALIGRKTQEWNGNYNSARLSKAEWQDVQTDLESLGFTKAKKASTNPAFDAKRKITTFVLTKKDVVIYAVQNLSDKVWYVMPKP